MQDCQVRSVFWSWMPAGKPGQYEADCLRKPCGIAQPHGDHNLGDRNPGTAQKLQKKEKKRKRKHHQWSKVESTDGWATCSSTGRRSRPRGCAEMDSSRQNKTWNDQNDLAQSWYWRGSQDELNWGLRLHILTRIGNDGGSLLQLYLPLGTKE